MKAIRAVFLVLSFWFFAHVSFGQKVDTLAVLKAKIDSVLLVRKNSEIKAKRVENARKTANLAINILWVAIYISKLCR